MADHVEQHPVSFPDSALTRRLTRRAREPLGVINVRHPEQLQVRSTVSLGQRVEMLDRWKKRYGLTAPDATAAQTPAVAAHPLLMRGASWGSDAPAERMLSAPAQPFAMRSALLRSDVTPEAPAVPQFRVRRPVGVHGTDAPEGERAVTATFSQPDASESQLPLRVATVTPPAVADGPLPQIFRQPQQRKADAGDSLQTQVLEQPSPSHLSKEANVVSQGPETLASNDATSSRQLPLGVEAPRSSAAPELVLRRNVMEESFPTAFAEARADASILPVAPSKPVAAALNSLPLVQSQPPVVFSAAPVVLARKAIQAAGEAPSEPVAGAVSGRSTASAPEIPVPRSLPVDPPMIWRQADPTGANAGSRASSTSISTAPNLQIMRTPSGASSSSSSTATAAASSTPHRAASGPNVDYLAERVSRVLARQLAVERERRGMTP